MNSMSHTVEGPHWTLNGSGSLTNRASIKDSIGIKLLKRAHFAPTPYMIGHCAHDVIMYVQCASHAHICIYFLLTVCLQRRCRLTPKDPPGCDYSQQDKPLAPITGCGLLRKIRHRRGSDIPRSHFHLSTLICTQNQTGSAKYSHRLWHSSPASAGTVAA